MTPQEHEYDFPAYDLTDALPCPQCGAVVHANERACPECGYALEAEEEQ